ncbi:MAG: hypothetical protein IT210_00390 [Armatimonadetes bacterium]|nr:hypothetical protein [Armatimonadota bacterium]
MRPIIGIVKSEKSSASSLYLEEILGHAGLFWEPVFLAGRGKMADMPAVLILAQSQPLAAEARAFLESYVEAGGGLIGLGGTSGLDRVFGASEKGRFEEGYLRIEQTGHPVAKGLESSLHVFGGCALAASGGEPVLSAEKPDGERAGDAVVMRRFGKGQAAVIGPDLPGSVLKIQQGIPVEKDGVPAPDGSAPINDNILKAEDGMVLNWVKDRCGADDGSMLFRKPAGDELREILIRSILCLSDRLGVALPALWYWPRRLPAVGMISHDTDSNEPEKAWALLDVMNRAGVKSCWCVIYPGGYPPHFYRALLEQGFEIATHYDAMTGGRITSWGQGNFEFQHQWLLDMAGISAPVSNKNHYTRWEGRLDFFRWCEAKGIHADQTKGPSKKGSIGFPFGGSHPWFPLDDEAAEMRFIDVLEINMLTQDIIITCPAHYGPMLVDESIRLNGVAHFLFHPAHILKDGVADALETVVNRGREKGIEWWTSEAIYRWEKARRGLALKSARENSWEWVSGAELPGATLMALQPSGGAASLKAESETMEAFGFRFAAVTKNCAAGEPVGLEVIR